MGCAWDRNRWWHGISRSDSDDVDVGGIPVCNNFGGLKVGNVVALNAGVQDWSIVCVGAKVIHSCKNHGV
jgi:hypothetical protein